MRGVSGVRETPVCCRKFVGGRRSVEPRVVSGKNLCLSGWAADDSEMVSCPPRTVGVADDLELHMWQVLEGMSTIPVGIAVEYLWELVAFLTRFVGCEAAGAGFDTAWRPPLGRACRDSWKREAPPDVRMHIHPRGPTLTGADAHIAPLLRHGCIR